MTPSALPSAQAGIEVRKPQGLDTFRLDNDGCGLTISALGQAVHALIFCREGSLPFRDVCAVFNVTDEVMHAAVGEAYWLFIAGPTDDSTKMTIEMDGE